MRVHLLDYGAGNVRSVHSALLHFGLDVVFINKPEDIADAAVLVFPGVGSFGYCRKALADKGLEDALKSYLTQGRPFFGVCLGMQVLFESSQESSGSHGNVSGSSVEIGLGIIPGQVERFDNRLMPVPHMGWNGVRLAKSGTTFFEDGLEFPNSHFYFVHSFRATLNDANAEWVLGLTDYGDHSFVSCVNKGRVFATQFHPEKSGIPGLKLLDKVLKTITAVEIPHGQPLPLAEQMQQPKTQLAKRIVAALDVRENDDGDLVVTKGDQYDVREKDEGNNRQVRNLGKPVQLAERYSNEGADEIAFLNITSFRGEPVTDGPMLKVLELASLTVRVPLCIGGGIRDYQDKNGNLTTALGVAEAYFRSGADKVSIGSDAVTAVEQYLERGGIADGSTSIEQISKTYGAQAVVISLDPKRQYIADPTVLPSKHTAVKATKAGPNGEEWCWYQCTIKGGREYRDIDAVTVAKVCEKLGAGELMVNCIDEDGQGQGYDIALMKLMRESVSIPVIASSGAGSPQHFVQVFKETNVEAALAAGIFHRREIEIAQVKDTLVKSGVPARII